MDGAVLEGPAVRPLARRKPRAAEYRSRSPATGLTARQVAERPTTYAEDRGEPRTLRKRHLHSRVELVR
jgi:hypothetical protein